jgi:hypothetical protein
LIARPSLHHLARNKNPKISSFHCKIAKANGCSSSQNVVSGVLVQIIPEIGLNGLPSGNQTWPLKNANFP